MSIGTIVGAVFWLVEHWYVLAAIALAALGGAFYGGLVSIAAVIKAALTIAAEIAKFFATPANQIAAKALYGFVVFVLAGSLFYQLGKRDERATWRKAEAAHAAAMERLKNEAAAEAKAQVEKATAAERANTATAEQRSADYEAKLNAAPAGDDCRIGDDDLRAAGVQPHGNGADVDRHPKRLQRFAPHR